MATVFSGNGVLSGIHDSDEIDRRIEEDRRKASAAAELAAELQQTLDDIEQGLSVTLRDELVEEIGARKLSAETMRKYRADFLRFKAFCKRWDPVLPHLPASPQAAAGFMASECSRGLAHVNRLRAAIKAIHRAADVSDPTEDVLVLAVVRRLRNAKSTPAIMPN